VTALQDELEATRLLIEDVQARLATRIADLQARIDALGPPQGEAARIPRRDLRATTPGERR
jgi:hypothetical protein